jgi:hypothetical protein
LLYPLTSCNDDFLEFFPEDKITSANFPQNEEDIELLLNGVYALLRENSIYNEGLFGFGVLDGATPNAFNWGNTPIARAGNGQLNSSDGSIVNFRWTRSYGIIFRANYLLQALEQVTLSEDKKVIYQAEAKFLRGLAYSILGRATKGAALGMKMRALLYQGKYDQVLTVIDEIDALGKYDLFPSYEGLFKLENENNQEVIFDIQYISGENSQGSLHDQYCGTGTGSWTRGSRYVPTDDLVSAYEMVDGSEVDPNNPYEGRDPRLGFTVVVPGAYILGYRFPNYEYPGGAYNHPGNRLKHLSTRKYRIEPEADLPPSGQSALNNMVIRYADVILSQAEAIIETNGDIDEAISLINRIRTGRDDVKITALPMGLSQEEARTRLRHERRIEFAMEGLYWSDIKRWNVGSEIYPLEIKDHNGNIIETKFPDGYLDFYQLLPIPDSEISLNENLTQNPGW